MYRFFLPDIDRSEKTAEIRGEDYNHIKNVLRLRPGERVVISNGCGLDFICMISGFTDDSAECDIIDISASASELPCNITLFQGVPKSDKLEMIIQKAVELGAFAVVPVIMERTIVRLDDAKKDKRIRRYNMIAESAAKQSGRGIIPEVRPFLTFKEALGCAASMDYVLVPYENARGIEHSREVLRNISEDALKKDEGLSIGIFIGPEGGFAASEIDAADEAGAKIITLGNRILRTETAGLTVLSWLMLSLER